MRGLPRTVALTALLLVAGGTRPVRASEAWPSDHGFEIGFRTGASVPVGDVESGWPLSDSRGVQFPLWLDLGYRVGAVVVGAYGQWAPGLHGSQLECRNASCFVYAWKAGVEVQIHPVGRHRSIDPWLSFGFGYEWNDWEVKDATGGARQTLEGWDFARYGLGVDFALTPSLRIGPFIHGTVSQFTKGSWSGSPPAWSWSISERAVHSWITLGVRLTGLL
jgi:hypothetical protein